MPPPQLNRVEIIVDVDPQGRAAAGFAKLHLQVNNLNTVNVSAASSSTTAAEAAGRGWSLASLKILAATYALERAGKKALEAAQDAARAQRFIATEATDAGVGWQKATAEVESYRKAVGTTRAEAQRIVAGALQFATETGRVSETELFTRRLTDIAIARGRQLSELPEIIRTLSAGRSAELGKLLGENINKVEAEGAARLGLDFSKLDDAGRKAIAFDEIIRRGAAFNGEAASRLKDTAGQVDLFSNRLDDAIVTLGQAIEQNGAFNDVLQSTISLLSSVSDQAPNQIQDAQKAADDAVNSFAGQFTIRIRQTAVFLYGVGKFFIDAASVFVGLVKDLPETGFGGSQDPIFGNDKFLKNTREALAALKADTGENDQTRAGAEERLRQETVERVNRQNQRIVDSDAKAEKRRTDLATQAAGERADAAAKAGTEAADKAAADAERKEFDRQRQALQVLRGLRGEAEGIVKEIAGMVGNDNPFVRIFVEADKAGEALEKRFALLGDTAVAKMQEIQAAAEQTALLTARIESQGRQAELSGEAGRLRRGLPFGTFAEADQNRLDIFRAQQDAADRARNFGIRADALRAGFATVDPTFLAGRQFQDLQKAQKALSDLPRAVRDAGQAEIDERITRLFDSLDDGIKRQIAGGLGGFGQTREVFAAAFEREGRRGADAVRAAIEKSAIAEENIARVRQNVADVERLVAASNAPDKQTQLDKAILARTRELTDAQLPPDLRRARIGALDREAAREAKAEQRAEDEVKNWQAFRETLLARVDNLTQQVKDRNESAIIEIRNKSQAFVDDDLLGEKPKPPVKRKQAPSLGGANVPIEE